MSRLRWALLLVLIVTILAFKFLPWYVLVGLAVLAVFGAPLMGRWLLYRLFLLPFKAKGAVLHRAAVTVHALDSAARPAPAETARLGYQPYEGGAEPDAADDQPTEQPVTRNYYRLVVTVTPRPKGGGFQHWEPGELRLVLPQTRPMRDDDDACTIEDLAIEEGGAFRPDEGFKLHGEQKLRLLLGVRPGVGRLVFQYYFETFGEVVLPTGGVV